MTVIDLAETHNELAIFISFSQNDFDLMALLKTGFEHGVPESLIQLQISAVVQEVEEVLVEEPPHWDSEYPTRGFIYSQNGPERIGEEDTFLKWKEGG